LTSVFNKSGFVVVVCLSTNAFVVEVESTGFVVVVCLSTNAFVVEVESTGGVVT
jgi:hypothetical protein